MSCFCPPGFVPVPTNDECIFTASSTPIIVGTLLPVSAATTFGAVNTFGTIFYEDISKSNGIGWPIKLTANTGNFQTQNGTPLYNTSTYIDDNGRILNIQKGGYGRGYIGSCGNNLLTPANLYGPKIFNLGVWGNRASSTQVWPTQGNPAPPFNEWIGFSVCIDFPYEGTYYVGLTADDEFRFSYNGEVVVESSGNVVPTCACDVYNLSLLGFSVFPITLNSGLNTIQIEGRSSGTFSGLGCEIYSADSLNTLISATNATSLSALTIFSTINKIESNFELGETSGYTCPSGSNFVNCGTPSCVKIKRTPCINQPTTSTTTTTTRPYINQGYIPVNDCDVLTISPLNVTCLVTNITGKPDSSNGSIFLSIQGGTQPYSIKWTYPNGTIVPGGVSINGLSVGTYVATVTDFYGDYTFTTSCTIPGITTTTTSTTTLPPIPNYLEYLFCLSIVVKSMKGLLSQVDLTFQLDNTINGYPSWISNLGQEIVYFNPSVGTSGLWVLSASTLSTLNSATFFNSTQPNWQVYNSSPVAPIPNVSPNFVGWSYNSSVDVQSVTSTKGACGKFLLLTINEWWGLNEGQIPQNFRFTGTTCNGSNQTPWFKWYLLGGLTSADVSSYEIFAQDLDVPGYVHWDVSAISNLQNQVSSSIPWISTMSTPIINSTTGGVYNSLGWEGPCPPAGQTHTYRVTLTAYLVAGGSLTDSVTFYSTTP